MRSPSSTGAQIGSFPSSLVRHRPSAAILDVTASAATVPVLWWHARNARGAGATAHPPSGTGDAAASATDPGPAVRATTARATLSVSPRGARRARKPTTSRRESSGDRSRERSIAARASADARAAD